MSADPPIEQHASGNAPRRWLFWGFLIIAAYFLLTEHRAHVIEYLPFTLLFACLLMHVFGHGGHGGHGGHAKNPDSGSAHTH